MQIEVGIFMTDCLSFQDEEEVGMFFKYLCINRIKLESWEASISVGSQVQRQGRNESMIIPVLY
jgi:hypothetical protein